MILSRKERQDVDFDGTVIDIETIGDFDDSYESDSRRYKNLTQVIFGYVTKERLHVYCAQGEESILELAEKVKEGIQTLNRPFHAFNCDFESGVFFHHLGIQILFDGELQGSNREWKGNARQSLKIPNYDDPFDDSGKKCKEAWEARNFQDAMAHNRACLLKERDILIRRGHRPASKLLFVDSVG